MKKLLQLFGLLDIITLVRNYKHIVPSSIAWTDFPLITIGSTFLYALLVLSAFFLIRKQKTGLWLTYIQFPFRMMFLILSFGFLLMINNLFNNQPETYGIMIWILIGIEIVRLIFTILIHKKYFTTL
jgi:hypothetical protein